MKLKRLKKINESLEEEVRNDKLTVRSVDLENVLDSSGKRIALKQTIVYEDNEKSTPKDA